MEPKILITPLSSLKALKMVDSGYRLPPPPGCPKEIYKMMIQCW